MFVTIGELPFSRSKIMNIGNYLYYEIADAYFDWRHFETSFCIWDIDEVGRVDEF